jgi:hypothetical protein
MIEAIGPLRAGAKGLTPFPGSMPAIGTLESPHMQPQHDGTLQNRQVTNTTRSAFFHTEARGLTSRIQDIELLAFEVQIQMLGADDLVKDPEFW